MKIKFITFSGIFIFFFTAFLFSQESADTSDISFKPNTNHTITIDRFDNTEVKIDGALDEPVWKKLKRFANFSEVSPGDNTKPEEETEVMSYYDNDNFYIGIICYEKDMSKLRATISERDKMFNDDFAGIILDTYKDSKSAYEFFVNPYGIQGDLMWNSSGNEDETYDAVWYSESKIYKDRWTCEIAIPFKSIRFENIPEQEWHFHLLRIRPRDNRYQYSWLPINRDAPSLFTDYGILKGIKNVKTGKNFEILPYTLASQSGSISDRNNADSKFENDKIKGQMGLNLKYGITSNLTADFAINPDFSQVEADAGQIDVNTTFALFFTEKRPFFLEGNNIFNSPTNVVYTRSINSPLFAFKLSGKIGGKADLGFISAYDDKSPFMIPLTESSEILSTERKSLSNILRLKYDLGQDSYLGMIYTDREVKKDNNKFFDIDGYNRVLGIDGSLRFLKNYSVTFQLLRYFTKEINDTSLYYNPETFGKGNYTASFDGESFSGFGGVLRFDRSAKHWNFNTTYTSTSPEARRDNGYISSNNFHELSTWQGYTFFTDTKVVNRIQPSAYGMIRYDYDGKLKEQFLQTELYLQFTKQITFDAIYFLVNNEDFGGVFNKDVNRFSVNMNLNTFKKIQGGFYLEFGKSIVRETPSYVGYLKYYQGWATIKPVDRLVSELSYVYYDLAKSFDGEKLFTGYIFRDKTTYLFTKNISLRLVLQYDSFQQKFDIDPLLSYKLNPFSVFYLGSTHAFSEIESPGSKPRYIETDRQLFLKFQYMWRL